MRVIADGKFVDHNTAWSEAEKSILARLIGTRSFGDIARELPGRTIEAIRRRATILRLPRSGVRFSRRYRDEAFFSAATLQAAYWAGFIAADGCIVTSPRHEVRIGLHHRDAGHLLEFVRASKFSGPVVRRGVFAYLTVCAATRWIEDLERIYAVTARKTKTLEPPRVSGDAALAYISGYIDGDGCWHRDRFSGRLQLIVVGTHAILDWMDRTLASAGASVGHTTISEMRGISRRSWSGSHAESIARVLSQSSLPLLRRKWSVALARKDQ